MKPPKSFQQQIRELLAGGTKRGPLIEQSRTPAVLRMLGFPAAPLTVAPNIVWKLATGKDGTRPPLTQSQIERLPELLDDVSAVFDVEGDGHLTVLTTEVDGDGNPILIVSRANCLDGVRRVNAIKTAFGKTNPEDWLARHPDALRYIGEKNNPRLPLPSPICNRTGARNSEGSGVMILGQDALGKFKKESAAKALAPDSGASQLHAAARAIAVGPKRS